VPRQIRTAAFAVVLLSLTGCSVGEHDKLDWAMSLRVGQCADPAPGTSGDEVTQVRPVPCGQPHLIEVYARVPYPGAALPPGSEDATSGQEYPGQDVLQTFAREACAEPFRSYLGRTPRRESDVLTYLYPSVSSWTAAGAHRLDLGVLSHVVGKVPRADRSVVCVVRLKDSPRTGSVRGNP
jgi:hypothetical protein